MNSSLTNNYPRPVKFTIWNETQQDDRLQPAFFAPSIFVHKAFKKMKTFFSRKKLFLHQIFLLFQLENFSEILPKKHIIRPEKTIWREKSVWYVLFSEFANLEILKKSFSIKPLHVEFFEKSNPFSRMLHQQICGKLLRRNWLTAT